MSIWENENFGVIFIGGLLGLYIGMFVGLFVCTALAASTSTVINIVVFVSICALGALICSQVARYV